MLDNIGDKVILNETILSAEQLEHIQIPEHVVVYEVVRIIEKVPLFFEEHYNRLKGSLASLGCPLEIEQQKIAARIRALIDANGKANCNVKMLVYPEENIQNSLVYISKSYYPGEEEFARGVPVGLLDWERQDPNIKRLNHRYKKMIAKEMAGRHLFEILLVNNEKQITEGSRSNVFFVKGTSVFTAPGASVLKGITREYVLAACKALGIEVIEELINVQSLNNLDAAFLSGTSIKVLPVSRIDDYRYPSSANPTVLAIRNQFEQLIQQNIENDRF